jgi:WD40 repeat protein
MSPETQKGNSGRCYAVFLSYRHADNKEQGRQWATWLHQVLEGYEIPADLVGTKNSKGDLIPASLYPVFRDEEELPADADLTRNIRQALENSALLVVLCSPRAVESRFVADEIRYFKELGKTDRILALMIDGEPNASDDPGKAKLGIAPEAECLPEPLRYGVASADGKIDWNQRTEPIAADTRPEGKTEQGWTTGAAYREALHKTGQRGEKEIAQKVREFEQRLELAKLKVVAGALAVPLGVLTKRDIAMQLAKAKQRSRTLRRWLAAVGLLAVLAVTGGIFAWFQRQEAVHQQREVRLTFSKADFAAAVEKLDKRNLAEVIAHLCRALRTNPENHDAASLLFSILNTNKWAIPEKIFKPGEETSEIRAVDPNGQRVVVTSKDKTMRIWNLVTGQPVSAPMACGATVEFSPDGQWVLTVLSDSSKQENTAEVWDAVSGKIILLPIGDIGPLDVVLFSPDSRLIIKTASNGPQAWDVATGQSAAAPLIYGAQAKSFSSDQKRKIVISEKFVQVCDAATGEPISEPMYHQDGLDSVQFSADGKRVITISYNAVRVWDAATGNPVSPPLTQEGGLVSAAANSDASTILTDSFFDTLHIWDAATGDLLARLPQVREAWFSAKDRNLITRSKLAVEVWRISAPSSFFPIKEEGPLRYAAFSSNSQQVITTSGARFSIWDAANAQPVRRQSFESGNPLGAVALSADRRRIVTTLSNVAFVSDPATGKTTAESSFHEKDIVWATFSLDGKRVATVDKDGTVRIWDADTGKDVCPAMKIAGRITSLFFGPDGKSVLIAIRDTAQVWSTASGQPVSTPMKHAANIQSALFSPDGKRVVTASDDKTARVWDTATAAPVSALMRHEDAVRSAEFSADGRYIVTASRDKTARVWNAATGEAVSAPMKHADQVLSASFSPDQQFVVTASLDQTARVWDALTGSPVTVALRHDEVVTSAALSQNNQRLLTQLDYHSAELWPFSPDMGPAWVLDLAETVVRCRMDSTGNPALYEGKTLDWLRQQAAQEPNKIHPMVVWAGHILKVDK